MKIGFTRRKGGEKVWGSSEYAGLALFYLLFQIKKHSVFF